MDMGGASTEIAFSVANDASGSEYHLNELLADTPHRIYARSYLCYGYYEARARFLAQLVNDNNVSMDSLCAVTGYSLDIGFIF